MGATVLPIEKNRANPKLFGQIKHTGKPEFKDHFFEITLIL